MSPVRLNGSTSGNVSIDAPAVAGNNTLILPGGNGSANERLVTNGSGTLSWSSDVMLAAGSAASPSLYFSGDTNTGMWSPGADTLAWSTGGTERTRISSSGAFSHSPCNGADLIGTEACGFVGDNIYAPIYKIKSAITSTKNCAVFVNGNGQVGSIQMNGSATSYNTSSDYRLKENVCLVSDGIARLQQLKPSRFSFIADPDKTVDGFIAHEVQSVVPEAITGEKDAVDADGNPIYQGIDQSKLVPLLTAALQEAVAKIESLEARIAALEVTP